MSLFRFARGAAALLAVLLAGCTAQPPPVAPIRVEITAVAGAQPLAIGDSIRTAAGEDFTVRRWQFYLSRPRLLRADGSWVELPDDAQSDAGYYLFDLAKPDSGRFHLPPVPAGDYAGIEFTIGVDAARNAGGAQTGVLDPARGLFWTWATGYIHFKLEGVSQASTAPDHAVSLHLGGDGVQRSLFLPFAAKPLRVSADLQPIVHLHADLAAFFGGEPPFSFAGQSQVMQAQDGLPLADRLVALLRLDHLHHEPAANPAP